MGKTILPHSLESEQGFIGTLMSEPDTFSELDVDVKPEYFYDPSHREIYKRFIKMFARGSKIDMITLTEQLEADGVYGKGKISAAYLAVLNGECSPWNLSAYADNIIRLWECRQKIYASIKVKRELLKKQDEQTITECNRMLFDAVELNAGLKRRKSTKQMCAEVLEDMDKQINQHSGIVGITTGFDRLDEKLCGYQKQNLIIIAARPSTGKTSFAIQSYGALAESGQRGLFVSLEMSAKEVIKRRASQITGVPGVDISAASFRSSAARGEVSKAIADIAEYWDITDDVSHDYSELMMRLQVEARAGLRFIMIDHLQLIHHQAEKRYLAIGEITSGLKRFAKQHDIPVILLSQLNRNSESTSREPRLSDLKESGSIEENADVVLFLYRDKLGKKDDIGHTEIVVAKHRNGPTGYQPARFEKECTKFIITEGEV